MPSKLGDVGKLPTSNALGNVGEGQQLAQHTQNIRQHGANIAGQQIYNNPTTPAGQDAQHRWHQNNPTPKMGGLAQQQQNVQNDVDRELVARGAGPGFAHAQARLQGQQPVAPQQSEAVQHAHHQSVMDDIKAGRGGPSRVNIVNPSKPININKDRQAKADAYNEANGHSKPGTPAVADIPAVPPNLFGFGGKPMVPGKPEGPRILGPGAITGAHIAQGGTHHHLDGPVAQANIALHNNNFGNKHGNASNTGTTIDHPPNNLQTPQAPKAKPNFNVPASASLGGGSLGGAAAQRPQISSLPGAQQTTAQLQQSGQMAPRPPGRYGMTDDQWFNTPEGQKQAQDFVNNYGGKNFAPAQQNKTNDVKTQQPIQEKPMEEKEPERPYTPPKYSQYKPPVDNRPPTKREELDVDKDKNQGAMAPKPEPKPAPPKAAPSPKPIGNTKGGPNPGNIKVNKTPQGPPKSLMTPQVAKPEPATEEAPVGGNYANQGNGRTARFPRAHNLIRPNKDPIFTKPASSPITNTIKAANTPAPVAPQPKLFPRLGQRIRGR